MSWLRKKRRERRTEALMDAVSYASELLRDERLRSDLQSAAGHVAVASERARKDAGFSGMTARLASDKKLRKNLRAILHDLEHASERVRHRERHRMRQAFLLLLGAGGALAARSSSRHWLVEHLPFGENGSVRSDSAWSTEPLAAP